MMNYGRSRRFVPEQRDLHPALIWPGVLPDGGPSDGGIATLMHISAHEFNDCEHGSFGSMTQKVDGGV
jgi:hypothetical protein